MRKSILLACFLIFTSLMTSYAAETTVVAEKKTIEKVKVDKQKLTSAEEKKAVPRNDDSDLPIFDANHNDLYRSYVNTHDITQVDPFTGNMTARLPLLNIPGNDHLPLQVTLLFDNSIIFSTYVISMAGYGWAIVPGIYAPGAGAAVNPPDAPYYVSPTYTPVFLAPDGTRHTLYSTMENCGFQPYSADLPTQTCPKIDFISKDNWHATLDLMASGPYMSLYYSGTVTSPDGIRYQIINPPTIQEFDQGPISPVSMITSASGGTVLTYKYDNLNGMTSITRNDGFTVTFTNTAATIDRMDQMQTNDGRIWHFGYQDFVDDYLGHVVPTLTSVTLPNNTKWQFQPVSNGIIPVGNNLLNIQLNKVISPTGLISSFTYGNNYPFNPQDPKPEDQVYSADRIAIPYVFTKTLSSLTIPTATWTYSYNKMTPRDDTYYYTNQTTISGPINKIVDTFDATQNGVLWNGYFEPKPTPATGTLLEEDVYDLNNNQVQDTKYVWNKRNISQYPPAEYWCFPPHSGPSPCKEMDGFPQTMPASELQQKTITRDGATYTTTYSNYDQYGYPGHIVQSSAAGNFSEDLTYYEDPNKWIFKPQNDTISDGGGVANSITRQFDSNGNMTQETDNGVVTNYAYDSAGNLTSKTDAANNVTSYSNYVAGTPSSTTDAMGEVTKRDLNTNGTVNSVTDPNGFTTSYTYDPLYRLASITPPRGLPTTLTWADTQNGTDLVMDRGNARTVINYTSLGQDYRTERVDSDQDTLISKTYDPAGNLLSQSYPFTPPGSEGVVTYTYDALNRVTSMTDGDNFKTKYAYNNLATYITQPNGVVVTKTYRAYGDPDKKQLMGIIQGPKSTLYRRLLTGELVQIQQGTQNGSAPAAVRNYNYDPHHYLISEVNPENGTTTYGRDILGNMTSKQVGSLLATTYGYDRVNRLVTTTYRDAKGLQSITRQYDDGGRLTNVRNTSLDNNWAYTYDPNNNLTNADLHIVSTKNSADYNFSYEYDGNDHLHTMTYPDGTVLTYAITAQGRVLSIDPYIVSVGYFSDDQIAAVTNNNGTDTWYSENGRHMRNSVVTKNLTDTLVSKSYIYDGMGNVSSITDGVDPTNNESFTYDQNTNELIGATGPWGSGTLKYDIIGNILSNTTGDNILYTYDTSNLLTRITGSRELNFSYDGAGDITNIGGLGLTYNNLQQVISMNGASIASRKNRDRVAQTYSYDGNGNRVQVNDVINNTNTFEMYNLKSQLLYKDAPATNTHDLYVMLGGHTVAHVKKAGSAVTTEFHHNDLLGSPVVTTDNRGQSVWTQRYLPYGEQMDEIADIAKLHTGYTGKPHDEDSDLSYYGTRYYFPFIGRFISPDPAAVNPEMPITFNRYAYAANNPYKYVDPDGRLPDGVEQVIGYGVGYAIGYGVAYAFAPRDLTAAEKQTIARKAALAGMAASIISDAASIPAAAAAAGLGVSKLGVTVVSETAGLAASTATSAAISYYSTGQTDWKSALIEGTGARLMRGATTFGVRVKGLPGMGQGIIRSNMFAGDLSLQLAFHSNAQNQSTSDDAHAHNPTPTNQNVAHDHHSQ